MSLPVAAKTPFGGDYNPELRIDEWDAQGPEVVNPVRLRAGQEVREVASRLVFELVIPQGAEVLGTYRADFYAGTPAVTRNSFGSGHGWYVAAGLDQAGVDWVVRQVLDAHGISGRLPGLPGVESASRVAPDGTRLLFLLNHGADPVEFAAPVSGVDLLTGARTARDGALVLAEYGVAVLREDG